MNISLLTSRQFPAELSPPRHLGPEPSLPTNSGVMCRMAGKLGFSVALVLCTISSSSKGYLSKLEWLFQSSFSGRKTKRTKPKDDKCSPSCLFLVVSEEKFNRTNKMMVNVRLFLGEDGTSTQCYLKFQQTWSQTFKSGWFLDISREEPGRSTATYTQVYHLEPSKWLDGFAFQLEIIHFLRL